MNRSEYIKALNEFLSDLPDDERLGAISYHEELFDDAGAENEEQVIESLGSPRYVADTILKDSGMLAVRNDNASENTKADSASTINNQNAHNNQNFGNQNNAGYNQQYNPNEKKAGSSAGSILLMILIIVLTSGLWISIMCVLFSLFIGVCAAGLGLIIGFGVGGVTCLISGIYYLFTALPVGLITIGIGCVLIALMILVAGPIFKLGINLFKWSIELVVKAGRSLYNWLKGVLA